MSPGERGMRAARRYVDLSPTELLGRRYVAWGSGLFGMPLILISCHLEHFLCGVDWRRGVVLLNLWWLFLWVLPVALVMLGGLGMDLLGVALLYLARLGSGIALNRIEAIALCTNIGSLIAILLVGLFGYFAADAVFPGFFYSPLIKGKIVWILLQVLLVAVYCVGAVFLIFKILFTLSSLPRRIPDKTRCSRRPGDGLAEGL
jgi:hypothetical protein